MYHTVYTAYYTVCNVYIVYRTYNIHSTVYTYISYNPVLFYLFFCNFFACNESDNFLRKKREKNTADTFSERNFTEKNCKEFCYNLLLLQLQHNHFVPTYL